MPERTKLTLEQLRQRAAQRITKYKTASNTEIQAATEAIAHLLRDVFKYRERAEAPPDRENESAVVTRLRGELDAAEEEIDRLSGAAPVVPQGGIILTKEQAEQWTAFQALNLEPAKVAERLKVAETLETEKQTTDRKASLREWATAAGFKNPDVFADLVDLKKLHVEARKVTRPKKDAHGNDTTEKETVELPHVRPAADDKAPLVLASDYVSEHAKSYLPALMAETSGGEGGQGAEGGSGSNGSAPGVRVPVEPGKQGQGVKAGDPASYIGRTYVTPSQRRSAAETK